MIDSLYYYIYLVTPSMHSMKYKAFKKAIGLQSTLDGVQNIIYQYHLEPEMNVCDKVQQTSSQLIFFASKIELFNSHLANCQLNVELKSIKLSMITIKSNLDLFPLRILSSYLSDLQR